MAKRPRSIWKSIIRHINNGVYRDVLVDNLANDGFSTEEALAAIEKMKRDRKITELDDEVIITAAQMATGDYD